MFASATSPVADLYHLMMRQRRLIWEMSKREITDRYAGQILGSFWAIGHSLILILVYAIVFTYVFKLKIGGTVDMPLDFTVYLLSALIPWMAFSESMNKVSTVIAANSNLVKQVVFPVEVLPIKSVVASMLTQFIGTFILMVYVLVVSGHIPKLYLMLPVLFLLQFMAMCGVGFFLSSLSPYARDVKDVVQAVTTVGMYVLPISYLPQWVPGVIRPLLYLNPFSYLCWCYQDVCYFGRFEHPWAFPVFALFSVGTFYFGFRVFRKLKVCFGSVL